MTVYKISHCSMPILKSDFLKASNKNRDTLLVLIGVACSIFVLDYAGKTTKQGVNVSWDTEAGDFFDIG
jgi:hypothetical protein